MDSFFIKANGALHPASDHDRLLLDKIKSGTAVRIQYKKVRNYQHHKKFFALIEYLYDIWAPPENHVGEKNRDQFREDIIILAGFYDRYVRVDGSTRIKAKSMSFGSMDQNTFDDLYSAVIDAGVKHICKNYTGESLREVLQQVEEFD